MKKLFIIYLFLVSPAFAENIIYKCTSISGEITYQNNAGDKNECAKTNLASFQNINFFKTDKNNNISQVNNKTSMTNLISDDQYIRDSKRSLILTQELSQEKEQLNTVLAMIKNLQTNHSTDNNQLNKLEELKNSHNSNIVAIEKELGNTKISSQDNNALKIEKATFSSDLFLKDMFNSSRVSENKLLSLPTSLPDILPSFNNKNNLEDIHIKNSHNAQPLLKKPDNNSSANLNKKKTNNSLGDANTFSSGLSTMSKVKK